MDVEDADPSATHTVHRGELNDTTRALDALTAALDGDADFESVLQLACDQVTQVIAGSDLASVSPFKESTPFGVRTLACTSDLAYYLDEQQYADGDGPCLHAAATNAVVRGDLEEAGGRWPAFARALREAGIASYLAAPLYIGADSAGALNLYGRQPHGFREVDEALLALYSSAVQAVLRATTRQLQARQMAEQLASALHSRAVIDQAKGILMATMTITADEAFDVLVQHSQRGNVKLRDVAKQIVDRASPN